MRKIELDHTDHKMNQRQAIQVINSSGMSRAGLYFNFVGGGDKVICLITTCDEEREGLPTELQQTSISYKNLKAQALS